MDAGKDSDVALPRAFSRLLAGVLQGLRYRGELLSVELREEKRRLFSLVLGGTLAALCGMLALLSLNLLLLILFWEEHRIALTAGFLVFYLLLALVLAIYVRRRVRTGPPPFQASFDELNKDRERFLSGR